MCVYRRVKNKNDDFLLDFTDEKPGGRVVFIFSRSKNILYTQEYYIMWRSPVQYIMILHRTHI